MYVLQLRFSSLTYYKANRAAASTKRNTAIVVLDPASSLPPLTVTVVVLFTGTVVLIDLVVVNFDTALELEFTKDATSVNRITLNSNLMILYYCLCLYSIRINHICSGY